MTTKDAILDRLPSTTAALATELGISREAVGQHLRSLMDTGVVRPEIGVGAYIWHLDGERPPRPPDRECVICERLLGTEKYHRGREGYSAFCKECSKTRSAEVTAFREREQRLKAHIRRATGERTFDSEIHEYAKIIENDPCAYCGGKMTVIDHIEPLSKGGLHRWDNLTPACGSCNARKSARTLLETLGSLVGVE